MTISIVAPTRAELGPLQSVIKALPGAVVTRFDSSGMSPAVAMSQALTYFTAMFRAQNATRVVVLGDRYETLAAALAAMFLRIPVAHIHGGEITTGAFDDPMRDAITHIADLHFVATHGAADRVAHLKDCPDQNWADNGIRLVGAPGLDGIAPNSARRSDKRILCTYHPETRAEDYGIANCKATLDALAAFPDYDVLFTTPNADPGAGQIAEMIDGYMADRTNWRWVMLDHDNYVQAMQTAALVIGNSSAGIIEAPWVGVPSVNIGKRQHGREMANTIFHSTYGSVVEMTVAIRGALVFTKTPQPIYRGGAAEKIAQILLNTQEKAA